MGGVRVETSLPPEEAYLAMTAELLATGVHITQTTPLLQGQIVTTRHGNIRNRTVLVSIGASPHGSVVTVNGQDDAYLAGRRAARSLPR